MSQASVKEKTKTWTYEERIAAQRKCVDLHVAIENAQQIERIIPETFAKKGIFYHLAPGVVDFQGPSGVRDFYDMLFSVLPDIHIKYSHEYDVPGYSIREGIVTGTHSAEFAGVPASGRKVRLHIGHIKDKILGGKDELSNLRALCSTCNQGAKNITSEKPTAIWLLGQIRRAGIEEQKAVLAWLQKKFCAANEFKPLP